MTKIERKIHKLDASDKVLGRLSTQIAGLLRGKHKTSFAFNIDIGDFVEVSNIDKLKVSGKKAETKKYFHHSGYPGGMKTTLYKKIFKEKPADILRTAVFAMLPGTRLRKNQMQRLIIK